MNTATNIALTEAEDRDLQKGIQEICSKVAKVGFHSMYCRVAELCLS